MNPILFLDIDGVLNSVSYAMERRALQIEFDLPLIGGVYGMDVRTVRHLQRIIDETNCDMVLMSSWRRIHPLYEVQTMLQDVGLMRGELISKTPCLKGVPRGDEVCAWVWQNLPRMMTKYDAREVSTKYVCLDDSADFHEWQPLVRTDNQIGLTSEDADRCINILKN